MSSVPLPASQTVTPFVSGFAGAIVAMAIISRIKSSRQRSTITDMKDNSASGKHFTGNLAHEQEAMRMQRDERKQTPVLTNWEQEL